VYICTYDEAVAVLEATLAGCALLDYPHTTHLLDDGRRPEIAALAELWDAHYLTRPEHSHAKAGNINHALPRTTGELVLVLDADHVPLPDALDTLVGYFDDPKVALVQSPHDFHDSVQHYDLGRHEQSVFFAAICPGKDRHNASFWCGSGALIRRAALLEVGGVATETIAEDFHTTIKLHRAGWPHQISRSSSPGHSRSESTPTSPSSFPACRPRPHRCTWTSQSRPADPDGESWRIGASIADCSEEDRQRVIEYCHVVWPYLRPRGVHPEPLLESEPVADATGALQSTG
jgi:cellulose synthase/poly-beta-1,6-N-acetylglucosamine synthase-like glycosyltransferase